MKTNLIQYDIMDSNGDVFKKGCFDKQIKKLKAKIKLKHPLTRKVKGKQYARPFITSWVIPIKDVGMSWIDLKLNEAIQADTDAIYSAFGIPKEMMK